MKRRDVLTGGLAWAASLSLLPTAARSSVPCPPALEGAARPNCPAPQGTRQWTWDLPTVKDETDFYTNVLGWTIPAHASNPSTAFGTTNDSGAGLVPWPSRYSLGSINSDTEGDDLWTWWHQNRRWNTSFTNSFYPSVLSQFKSNLLDELDSDPFDQHFYGQGLAVVYNQTSDSEIPAIIEGLKTRLQARSPIQQAIARNPIAVNRYLRQFARYALVTAYCYQALPDGEWEQIRDACVWAYENATDWEEGGVIAAGGNYFASEAQASSDGFPSQYDAGYRYGWSPGWGIATEALWRLYLQTGSAILKDRMIKMAQYVAHYVHKSSWGYGNCGSRWGHTGNGEWWHPAGGGDAGAPTASAVADCSYDAGVINTLVVGYKLTGDSTYLTKAQELFTRCNRWDPGSSRDFWASSYSHVLKYTDTQPNNSNSPYFQWNKGVLQYCYLLFENGGRPSILA